MTPQPQPLAVVGTSYVGLVTAAGFAEQGHEVWCADRDLDKIETLNSGGVPISEPGIDKLVPKLAGLGRLHFVTTVGEALERSGARVLFVAVGTPAGDHGANLTQVHGVIDEIPADAEIVVVMKSTVPPGTGQAIAERAIEEGKRFAYVSCPEFLQEGEALRGVQRPERVVLGGVAGPALDAIFELHRAALPSGTPIETTDVASAEMAKLTSNVHLAMRIALTNEIANVCEKVGADAVDVMRIVGLDPRIGSKFVTPGLGFGGSCLSKDVAAFRAVAKDAEAPSLLVGRLLKANKKQPMHTIRKLEQCLGGLEGRTVALLGLAFKPDTGDLRNAPAFVLAHKLRARGATVRAYDPDDKAQAEALKNGVKPKAKRPREWIAAAELAESAIDALAGADACILATEWRDFTRDLDWTEARAAMAGDLVLDGRNALDREQVERAGLRYEGIGRRSTGLGPPAPAGS